MKRQQHMGQEETCKKRDNNIATTAEERTDPNIHCKHCNVDGHTEEKCWKLHLELHPKWLKSKGKEKVYTETK
jgi:hypothetical protein